MAITITITDVGRQALTNAKNNGTTPVTIAQVGVGTGTYTPDPGQTALQAETKKLATIAGQVVAADTMHVSVLDESSDAYDVTEFGLYLDDGTLFAVYAVTSGTILQKTATSALLLAVDVIFSAIDATNLTFGSTSFSNPPASETVKGVVQLVDKPTVLAGTDALKAVTTARMNDFVMRYALGLLPPGLSMPAISNLNAAPLGWGQVSTSTANNPRSGQTGICFTFSSNGNTTPASSNAIFQMLFWNDGVKQERLNINNGGWVLETQLSDKSFATTAQNLAGSATDIPVDPAGVAAYVKQFGIGADGNYFYGNIDDTTAFKDGMYYVDTTATGTKPTGINEGHLWVSKQGPSTSVKQVLLGNIDDRMFMRVWGNTSWTAWAEVWSTQNFNPSAYLTTTNASIVKADSAPSNAGKGFSTTYTNSYGKPLIVYVSGHGNAGQTNNALTVTIDGVVVYRVASFGQPSPVGVNFIVPAGSSYRVDHSNAVILDMWYEQT